MGPLAAAPGPRYCGPDALIWCVPSGSSPPDFIPSGRPVAVPGTFHTIQCGCVSVPRCTATSGSSMLTTKLSVPAGTLVHLSSGEVWSPACVYFGGITPPSGQAVVDSTIGDGRCAAGAGV